MGRQRVGGGGGGGWRGRQRWRGAEGRMGEEQGEWVVEVVRGI